MDVDGRHVRGEEEATMDAMDDKSAIRHKDMEQKMNESK